MRPAPSPSRLVALSALVAGCVSPPLEAPQPTTDQSTSFTYSQNPRNKVDVLFLIDNSSSMSAMSAELSARFDQFFEVFQDLSAAGTAQADLHVGVVTSDFGAGRGVPGACDPSPGGQRGKLQALGVAAPADCLPPRGANYIEYAFSADGKSPNNLPPGQTLLKTFTCMASVGTGGCGFEHQLESVYSALHDPIPENQGFVRPGALLAVVFLTNEDDASAPPDTDVFDSSLTAQYGIEDSYSRQTRFAIVCGPAPGTFPPYGDSGGPLANCRAAPNPDGMGPGKQYDISRYIDFFTRPASQGGVKNHPNDVILVGIDAPSDPFQVILSNPQTPGQQPYVACAPLDERSNPVCAPVLQHSCQNPQNPAFFGDPAVRLNQVVAAAAHHHWSSICDSDYTGALQDLAHLIGGEFGAGCVPAPLPDPDHADCVVEDVTLAADGSQTVTAVPQCDPAAPAFPCWRVEAKAACAGDSPQGIGITIDRNGAPPPDDTDARVSCATLVD